MVNCIYCVILYNMMKRYCYEKHDIVMKNRKLTFLNINSA